MVSLRVSRKVAKSKAARDLLNNLAAKVNESLRERFSDVIQVSCLIVIDHCGNYENCP